MSTTPKTKRQKSEALDCKFNPENEIGDALPVYMPFELVVSLAPIEPIWANGPNAAPVAKALDKSLREECAVKVPTLEEESLESKKPLGLPPKPLHELLSRTSPEPESLYRWADRVEAERKQCEKQNE